MRRVVRCRVTAAQQLATNTQRTRPPERENSRRRISHHCVPNLLFSQKRQRAGFCSTAPARIVPFVSQAWNEMGTRFALCASPRPLRRTRNDSRSRSMSRSQSQHLRNAYPPSSRTSVAHAGRISNIFFGIKNRCDLCRRYAFWRDHLGNWPRRNWSNFRLFNPGCHEHRAEEQSAR